MGGGWAARLVLCIAAAACLCTVCAGKDPVTLHRIVTSSEGCGLDRATSAKQCEQFAAAGVQCPDNVSGGTSIYRGAIAPSMFPLGCACSDRSVYFRSPPYSTSEGSHTEGEPCSLSYPCICQFLPTIDNCTQGIFLNTTTNTTIRCTAAGMMCHNLTPSSLIPQSCNMQLLLRHMAVCLLHGTDALTSSHPYFPFLSPLVQFMMQNLGALKRPRRS